GTPCSIQARCTGWLLSEERPSMVTTFMPSRAPIGTEQDRIAVPLICTVQAPHCAIPQPNFVPVKPITSRNTQRSGVSGSMSICRDTPLTSIVTTAAIPPGWRLVSSYSFQFSSFKIHPHYRFRRNSPNSGVALTCAQRAGRGSVLDRPSLFEVSLTTPSRNGPAIEDRVVRVRLGPSIFTRWARQLSTPVAKFRSQVTVL